MREDLVGWLIREMRANTQDHRLKAIRTWNEAAEVYREERRYDLYNSANNAAALMWTILVGPGMEWDYKGLIRESVGYGYHYAGYNYFYDVWANINYGICRARRRPSRVKRFLKAPVPPRPRATW